MMVMQRYLSGFWRNIRVKRWKNNCVKSSAAVGCNSFFAARTDSCGSSEACKYAVGILKITEEAFLVCFIVSSVIVARNRLCGLDNQAEPRKFIDFKRRAGTRRCPQPFVTFSVQVWPYCSHDLCFTLLFKNCFLEMLSARSSLIK